MAPEIPEPRMAAMPSRPEVMAIASDDAEKRAPAIGATIAVTSVAIANMQAASPEAPIPYEATAMARPDREPVLPVKKTRKQTTAIKAVVAESLASMALVRFTASPLMVFLPFFFCQV